jgi:DNA ligase 1
MFLYPMLLGKAEEPFDSEDYITELKSDGFRILISTFNERTRLYTRHKNDITYQFKSEINSLSLPENCLIDGELVSYDENGYPDFELLQQRFRLKLNKDPIQFVIFDVLYFKGKNITSMSLLGRKEILNKIIPEDNPLITKTKWIIGNGVAYFQAVKERGLEGTVQKKINSLYSISKRSTDWLKVINYQYKSVNIYGLSKEKFGALLSFEDGSHAGLMEFIPAKDKRNIYKRMTISNENEKYIYFEEPLPCKVKFRNYFHSGKLRIPSFYSWEI